MQPLCQNAPLHNCLSLHFTKQIAKLLRGIFAIPFAVFSIDFFSFHTAIKEKQKNVA
ncbi:hypothetical protein HMPREF0765_3676 [Sphingobacterium spiritivorum ATCC 33300]|uniref:Uncharacterized protein n=1 Tax=Sphingobacterium spiritivorum ATCC 33300 TaxID=525372 RepID=C2G270_SPHSI|nr:hypothetical protein HMPREF0765_3676 [Sphingobacterium spiritivorum ATCC 33300]